MRACFRLHLTIKVELRDDIVKLDYACFQWRSSEPANAAESRQRLMWQVTHGANTGDRLLEKPFSIEDRRKKRDPGKHTVSREFIVHRILR